MRPHPRIRKAVKWGGLALAAALAIAWSVSMRKKIEYWYPGGAGAGSVSLSRGYVFYFTSKGSGMDSGKRGWHFDPAEGKVPWWPRYQSKSFGPMSLTMLVIPLVYPFALVAIPTVFAWRVDTLARRRAKESPCPSCGYSFAGLAPGGPCPECGKTVGGGHQSG